jgi:protein-disulfide isomerase
MTCGFGFFNTKTNALEPWKHNYMHGLSEKVEIRNNNRLTALEIKAKSTDIEPKDHIIGCKDAPNILVHYASLNCPQCLMWHLMVFPELKKNYIDTCKVKYVLRDFPLSRSGLIASKFVACSSDFSKLYQALLFSQFKWVNEENQLSIMKEIARENGINTSDNVESCMEQEHVKNTIYLQTNFAVKQLGVKGVPSFFVNGNKIEGRANINKLMKYMFHGR